MPARFADVLGHRTRYLALGEGSPVLLLHGLSRSLEDWSATLAPLGAHHRVYALDLAQFNAASRDAYAALGDFAHFAKAFLDAVGEHRPLAVIGNSLGGAVALRFAADYPERVAKLVLAGSAGFGRGLLWLLRLLALPGVGELCLALDRLAAEIALRCIFYDPRFATRARVRETLELVRRPGAKRALLRALRAFGSPLGVRAAWRRELAQRLAAHPVPMLVVWGERDRILPVRHLQRVRRLYPHARTHLFRNTGHAPQLERAAAFNRLVLEFLAEAALPDAPKARGRAAGV
ncbi:alpha/beta hydrolase fold protein [Truepera radiovictrix DSM 17093]|uniref:Alpha/beta hydrolase fold protein n=1 Tax=Truepera radiovictrix (strain DSM 17093 / CIP 108686 / LMG 22925 / RQ-24) TaxID=649638 RepID=D7CXK0_TRURR|nr:alpha/beta hydrolase fold protein [Truepera radiovictrix DSM 17093]